MKRQPTIVSGNRYYWLGKDTRICHSCGFVLANNASHHGKSCQKADKKDRNDLSECETTKNAIVAKTNRLKYKAEGRKINQDFKKKLNHPKKDFKQRICLRCDEPFKSEGRFNRICPKCSNAQECITGDDMMAIHRKIDKNFKALGLKLNFNE